jgi:hypothetical protein
VACTAQQPCVSAGGATPSPPSRAALLSTAACAQCLACCLCRYLPLLAAADSALGFNFKGLAPAPVAQAQLRSSWDRLADVDERIKARQRREQLLREVRSPGGLQLRRIGCIIVHPPSIHPSIKSVRWFVRSSSASSFIG